MTTAQILILLAIVVYLLFMLWIGWICAKKNESVDDFYLGGRKLGPFVTAMLISAAVIVIYTVMGGFLAASFTDLIQSIIMTVALIVVLGFGVTQAGGVGAVMENARSMAGYLSLDRIYDPATGGSTPYSLLTICSLLAWGLGYFGMPHILVRFMAIEEEAKLKLSRRVASSWVVISMGVAIVIGLVGNAMTSAGALEQLADSETIIVRIASLISQFGALPALLAGVILAGILAATMSTADSQLLAASSSISQDLGNDFLKRNFSGKRGMVVARSVMIAIALIAAFLARDPNSSVFRVVSFAWAGFGAAFGPTMLMALFWKRSNKWGALAGMITGGVMVFVWKFLIAPMGGAWAIYELLPAFLCALVAIVVVSLLTPAPERQIVEVFEEVKR